VICTAVSDLPVFLMQHSTLLCSPSDIESIRKALSSLLILNDDELNKIGEENRFVAKKYFDKSDKILAYLALMSS